MSVVKTNLFEKSFDILGQDSVGCLVLESRQQECQVPEPYRHTSGEDIMSSIRTCHTILDEGIF